MNIKYAIAFSIIIALTTTITGPESLENLALNLQFKIRGTRNLNKAIVSLKINEREFFNYITRKKTFDFRFHSKVLSSSQIFFEKFHNHFYWDTDFFINLLEKIKKYRPLVVAVIPSFSTNEEGIFPHSLKNSDKKKLEELSREIPVLWSSYLKRDGTLLSPPDFLTTGNIFYNNVLPDDDLIVRKARLKSDTALSLAGAIWLNSKVRDKFETSDLTETAAGNNFFINYSGRKDPGITFSAISFLEDIEAGWLPVLKDKIILIDIQADHTDDYLIPYLQKENIALVSNCNIQSEILSSLIDNRTINRSSSWLNLLSTTIMGICSALVFLNFSLILSQFLTFALALFFSLISIFLFSSFSFWLNTTAPLITIFITSLILTIWRYTTDERKKTMAMQREIDELKGNFLSLISHNLRTPIAKIRALSSVILNRDRGNLLKKQREAVTNILKSSMELTSYITNILNITRIDAQKVKLHKTPCDVNSLIRQAIEKSSLLIESKNITFSLKLEPIFSIELDRELFFQLFLNILENSIKYSPNNSEVTIETKEVDNSLYISVTDQGIGISKEEANNIFKKFHRVDNIYTETISGTGLGLYLVQYFVKLHGGEIKVNSVLGGGATFTIILPISQ